MFEVAGRHHPGRDFGGMYRADRRAEQYGISRATNQLYICNHVDNNHDSSDHNHDHHGGDHNDGWT